MNNLLNHEDIPDGSSAITSSTYDLVGNRLSKTAPPGGAASSRAYSYAPETGRWLSKDPIGLAGGLNLYAFCAPTVGGFTDGNG